MEECKICSKELKSNRSLSKHLDSHHNIKFLEYKIKYDNFKEPKCEVCGKDAKFKSGLHYRKTCGGAVCKKVVASRRITSEETKKKQREVRLAYMKENSHCTAWRLGNEMSWPEKVFINAVKRHGWYDKFEITREKSFYPYYADFAFENVKVVIEIDGGQHERPERKASDEKKDDLLISQGWRVYRIKAKQVLSDINTIMVDLESFIGDVETTSKTCKLLTGKEKKEIEAKNRRLEREIERNERREKFIEERTKDIESVDMLKLGWIQQLANKWKVSHTQVKRLIKKYYPELEYYQRK